MNTAVLTGHPAKLKDGSWGAHVNSPEVKSGDVVHVETKNGKQWTETVDRVIWTGNDSDGKPCALVTCIPREDQVKAKAAPAAAPAADDAGSDF